MSIIDLIKILGSVCALSGLVVMYFLFMAAYFNPSKTVCYDINHFNEADFEFYMINVQLILAFIGTACTILFRDRQKPKSNESKIPARNLASV